MLHIFDAYGELLSVILVAVAAIAFAAPALLELSDRRHWEALDRIIRRTDDPNQKQILERIRNEMRDERMGLHNRNKWAVVIGIVASILAIVVFQLHKFAKH